MDFYTPTFSDREWITKAFMSRQPDCCEFCFGNIFMWSDIYENKVRNYNGIFISGDFTDEPVFCYPAGTGNKKEVIKSIIDFSKEQNFPLLFYGLTATDRDELMNLFPSQFAITEDRDFSDYVYRTEDLANLAGRKYHGKRNHISYFENNFDWKYTEINPNNIEKCMLLNEHWEKLNKQKNPNEISHEHSAIKKALDNYFELGFEGGVLTIQDEIVAFTFGEKLNDSTFCTHVEKAYSDIRGAYQMINREFARRLLGRYEFINREDDTGSEGLRSAKLSYHPCRLVTKYTAEYRG